MATALVGATLGALQALPASALSVVPISVRPKPRVVLPPDPCLPAPQITSFAATPVNVTQGESSTLQWSLQAPEGCSFSVVVDGQLVGAVDPHAVRPLTTHTYVLTLRWGSTGASAATTTVNVAPIAVETGTGAVTAEDLREFDVRWMSADDQGGAVWGACTNLYDRNDAAAWVVGARMQAMVRMYETTHAPGYLHHLSDLVACALTYRDDRHPGPKEGETDLELHRPQPLDEIRGAAGLPAWGGRSVNSAGLHRVDETVSSIYAHGLAAFARLVAEDPDQATRDQYRDQAIDAADAVLETIRVFTPQLRFGETESGLEVALVMPEQLRTLLTESSCTAAGEAAKQLNPKGSDRYNQQVTNCIKAGENPGPLAYNEQQLFLMVLIEMSRVLDSDFYRQHSPHSANEDWDRVLFPLLVEDGQRYFANRVEQVGDGTDARFRWLHVEGAPPDDFDDPSHGGVLMRYAALLNRDLARLNARVAAAGDPAIPFDASFLRRFANTFLYITRDGHIAEDVDGSTPADPDGSQDHLCDGWIDLALVEPAIYDICHEMTLRVVNEGQPNLLVQNHAALLATKRLRYPMPKLSLSVIRRGAPLLVP